jgi:hypothetical protein
MFIKRIRKEYEIMSVIDTLKKMEGKIIKSVDLKLIGSYESLQLIFTDNTAAYINGEVNEFGVNELKFLGLK